MRPMFYILVGREVFPATAAESGAQFDDMRSRRVELTYWPDGTRVSTVFIGLDHSIMEEEPIVFETMAFPLYGSAYDDYTRRYSSYTAAESGHWQVVAKVTEDLGLFPIREEDWIDTARPIPKEQTD